MMTIKQFMEKHITGMKVKKIVIIFIIFILLLVNISCKEIVETNEIKEFVNNFNYDNTYNNTLFASKKLVSEVYRDGECVGKITYIESFDRSSDLYYYSNTIVEGEYYGTGIDEYDYHNKEVIYFISNDIFLEDVFIEKIDSNYNNPIKNKDEIVDLIKNFFYTDLTLGIHHGGTYYGDYVKENYQKYYNNFRLNSVDKLLTYNINTLSKKDELEIISSLSFTVNQHGLIEILLTKTMYRLNTDTYTLTSLNCNYKNKDEKKLS